MKKDVYFVGLSIFFFLLGIAMEAGLFKFLGVSSFIMEFGYIWIKTW